VLAAETIIPVRGDVPPARIRTTLGEANDVRYGSLTDMLGCLKKSPLYS
jgi:hypothetical protein